MRLEDGHDAAITRIARGAQGCDDLGRMMPVVVHDQDSVFLSLDLEPAVGVLEFAEGQCDFVEWDLEFQPGGQSGQSIQRAVQACTWSCTFPSKAARGHLEG